MKVRKETSGNFEMFDFIFHGRHLLFFSPSYLSTRGANIISSGGRRGTDYMPFGFQGKNSDSSKSDLAEKLMDSYH